MKDLKPLTTTQGCQLQLQVLVEVLLAKNPITLPPAKWSTGKLGFQVNLYSLPLLPRQSVVWRKLCVWVEEDRMQYCFTSPSGCFA